MEPVNNKPKRTRIAAGNTFKRDEVNGVLQLFELLQRGQDTRIILRSEAMRRVHAKFVRMRATLEREHREALERAAEETG